MLGSITPLGEQGRGDRWWLTATFYVVASAIGGATAGGLAGWLGSGLGLLGRNIPPDVALLLVAVLAILGLAVDAGFLGLRLPTLRRQVDERWLGQYRGWVVGLGFGFQLGLGLATLVTASATWAALAVALVSQSPAAGSAIGLAFGLARAAPLLLTARTSSSTSLRRLNVRLMTLARPVDRAVRSSQAGVAAVALLLLALPRFS